ncbi:MAG: hypothetical protein NVSMB62_06910 [Acidobacteriaceae bacterium]
MKTIGIVPKLAFVLRTLDPNRAVISSFLPEVVFETRLFVPNLPAALVFLEITYVSESQGNGLAPKPVAPDTYQLPLALTSGAEADSIRVNTPGSILASLTTAAGPTILHDATAREDFRQALLSLIETSGTLSTSATAEDQSSAAMLQGHASSAFLAARGTGPLPGRTGSAEQSNTSILYDQRLILKLFRRLQPGENPDTEIGRFLTEVAHFPRIAPFLGEIRGQRSAEGESTTLAMLQGLVQNEGDGWSFTLEELARFYEGVVTCPPPDDTGASASFLTSLAHDPAARIPHLAREHAGLYLEAAALLGRRTAEMHLALATPTQDAAFAAESFTPQALAADASRAEAQVARSLDALRQTFNGLADESTSDSAALILSRRVQLLDRARALSAVPPDQAGLRTRIHGDYHLGQVLRARGDYIILDFEGEPARPLVERRAKQSPLKDVAGMLRSFSYAAFSGLDHFVQRHPNTLRTLEPWAQLWQNAVSTEFLHAWRSTIAQSAALAPPPEQAHQLLSAYLLEKAMYELLYELNNRPTWVRIPLAGVLALP